MRLTSRERVRLDTLYARQIELVRPQWDSLCDARFDSMVRVATDSLVRIRREEEARLRTRIQ